MKYSWNLEWKVLKILLINKKFYKEEFNLSITILSERNNLNVIVENLQLRHQIGLNKITSFRDLFDKIDSAQKAINGSKNFETYVKNAQVIKGNLPLKTYTALSVICNHSCHQIYLFSNDEEKDYVPQKEERIAEYKGKYHWTQYHNVRFIIECF